MDMAQATVDAAEDGYRLVLDEGDAEVGPRSAARPTNVRSARRA